MNPTSADHPTNPPAHPLPSTLSSGSPLAGPTPLWAVLLLTFVCSLGTGVGCNGVFFIAESALEYTSAQNLLLGLMLGLGYTSAALLSSSLHAMIARHKALSTRGMLVAVSVGLAAVCGAPFVLPRAADGEPGVLGFWVFAGGYILLAGLLWPLVETYVSGGRRGAPLRRATAWFNVIWATAVMASMWALSPLLKEHPWAAIAGLGALHLATVPLVMLLGREPLPHGTAAHIHDAAERELYVRLRRSFRRLLIVSYIMLAGVSPVLPELMSRLEIDLSRKPLIASVWMTMRLLMFVALWRWSGWHGRLTLAAWSGVLLGLGFAASFFAPSIGVLVIGLSLLGIGAGAAYFGALYYAMELDSAEVDAGGKHEALIGAGYALGPLLGALFISATRV